jgi:hypothetical protein
MGVAVPARESRVRCADGRQNSEEDAQTHREKQHAHTQRDIEREERGENCMGAGVARVCEAAARRRWLSFLGSTKS